MKVRVIGTIVAVLAVMLVSSVVLAAFPTQGVGRGSSDIWVMNIYGTEDANVVASYVDQDGNEDSSVGGTVDPLGNASFPASSSGLGNDWLGSMVLYSDRELASVAELFWRNVPKGDGWSGASYSGYSEGANEVFFPAIAKTPHHRSILTIQCVDTVDCGVFMTYRDRDANVITGSPFQETIEADSQESYDLWDPTLNPNIPDQAYTPAPWFGSLQVTSTQKIAGVQVTHYRQGYASAYNSFVPGSDTEIYFPTVGRRNFGGLWRGQSDWTAIGVQNMNTFSVTAYVNIYDRDGLLALQFTDDIPGLSSHAYNTRFGGNVAASTFDPLGDRFMGSAIISSTNPIVGSCTVVRYPSGGSAGTYNGLSSGSSTLMYPVAYRAKSGGKWVNYSSVVVQNMDPDNPITVYHQWLNSDGTLGVAFTDNIPAKSSHGYSTRYGTFAPTLAPLGNSWAGTVVISTTSSPGISGVVLNTTQGTGYMYLSEYNAYMAD